MLDLKYLKPREETDDCTLVVVSDKPIVMKYVEC